MIEGEYDFENWLQAVKGLEKVPEKGSRCEICFDKRFEVSANKALELGEDKFTTTLLVSPLKSQEQLKRSGEHFHKNHGVEFIYVDYRSNGGTQDQSNVTKEEKLYRQDYCGCLFGLTMQREQQARLMDEMFSPISNQILPASIEERLEIYKKRIKLEEKNIEYKIIKQKFLNYRQLSLKVIQNKKEIIPAYALLYSTLSNKKAQGKVEFENNNIYYFNRQEMIFITLEHFNLLSSSDFKNIKELIFNPLSFEKELDLRNLLTDSNYDLTPIIIFESIPQTKLSIELHAKTYEDVREKLIVL